MDWATVDLVESSLSITRLLSCIAVASIAGLIGCFYFIEHSSTLAAETARRFAVAAFVDRDFSKAADFVPAELNAEEAESWIGTMVAKMHPDQDFPSVVWPIGFEPEPGARIVKIYLGGGDGTTLISYYQITLQGEKSVGYRVIAMYRNKEMFPIGPTYAPVKF
jgi:hypothetical protein